MKLGNSKHFKPRNRKGSLSAYAIHFKCEPCAFVLTEQENPVQTQTGSIVEESGKGTCLLLNHVVLVTHHIDIDNSE